MSICKHVRFIVIIVLLFCGEKVMCQYYYTDVIALQQGRQNYITLKKNGVTLVTATSTDEQGAPVENFTYERVLKENASISVTITKMENEDASIVTDYYQNNRLARTTDSSDKVLTTTEYKYTSDGILSINSSTSDAFMDVHSSEAHRWFYNAGKPDSMLRIKNNNDTTILHFIKDSANNISEEIWYKKGRLVEHYFYYYNDKGLLTDIVRYNNRAKQMLPDYIFNYNENGQLTELTQVPQGFSNYTTWQYQYSSKGLKMKDVLLDKHQSELGTIIYSYK